MFSGHFMKINIKSRDLQITPAIEDYLYKKLETLRRFFGDMNQDLISGEAELCRTTRHHQSGVIFRAEVNLEINGKMFRVESEKDDLYAAIDEVRDDLEREIKKFKEKKDTVFIRGARSIKKAFRISPLARFRKK